MKSLTSFCEITCQIFQKKLEEKRIEEEQVAKALNRKLPVCYDDDDDEEESNSLKDNNISKLPSCYAATPNEPNLCLTMILQSFPLLRKSILFSMSSPVNSLFSNQFRRKTDCHPKNEIRLSHRLLYDNSSPCPPEEFNSENSNNEIKSFSPSPIPNKDCDSHMEEIDLFLTPNNPMSPSIEDDEDSEGDILFLERLLQDDPIPLQDTLDFSYE
nr:hypothetical protein [Tanacetum cinerariifolium]